MYQISEDISSKIKQYYPDQARIGKYLEEVAVDRHVKITIYDVTGNRVGTADGRSGYGLNLELKSFIVVGQNVIYVVELVYPFSVQNLGELHSVKKILFAAGGLLLLLIILLMIYLHFSLVRPLSLLNKGLENIQYHQTGVIASNEFRFRNDEIGDLTQKFQEMQHRLTAAYAQQTEMIASISHDLKTPLTSVIGFLERLLNRKLNVDKQEEYHRIIYQKALDMKELIAEFNEFVNSEIDNGDENKELVNLAQFFNEMSQEYSTELAVKGIQLISKNEVETDEWVCIDLQKIRRVFANLVNNSLKHAGELKKITFSCKVDQNQALFSVEDDGIGVPPQALTTIFEKFYRLDPSRSRDKGGSGLGLAICQRIIHHHHGVIHAYLNQDGGLGVSFTLPVQALHKNS